METKNVEKLKKNHIFLLKTQRKDINQRENHCMVIGK